MAFKTDDICSRAAAVRGKTSRLHYFVESALFTLA
jgi:hypothetical protein